MVMWLRNRHTKHRRDEGTYHECHHGHLKNEDANGKKKSQNLEARLQASGLTVRVLKNRAGIK